MLSIFIKLCLLSMAFFVFYYQQNCKNEPHPWHILDVRNETAFMVIATPLSSWWQLFLELFSSEMDAEYEKNKHTKEKRG